MFTGIAIIILLLIWTVAFAVNRSINQHRIKNVNEIIFVFTFHFKLTNFSTFEYRCCFFLANLKLKMQNGIVWHMSTNNVSINESINHHDLLPKKFSQIECKVLSIDTNKYCKSLNIIWRLSGAFTRYKCATHTASSIYIEFVAMR